MSFLLALADAFYRTFGVTEPAEHRRRQAAFFFLFLLLLIPTVIASMAYLFLSTMRR